MPYEQLGINTPSPILSWANHLLASDETKMAKKLHYLISYIIINISHLCLSTLPCLNAQCSLCYLETDENL
jgi:hypothetical protein